MPNLTSPTVILSSDTTLNSVTPQHVVHTKAQDANGNIYILLGGVASTKIGSAVTFDENGSTLLLAADAVGPVAIAMAAVTSPSNYGWYQVQGKAFALVGDGVATDNALYISGTSGYVSDADVAGDVVIGMVSVTAQATAGATTTVWMNYPYVSNIAVD